MALVSPFELQERLLFFWYSDAGCGDTVMVKMFSEVSESGVITLLRPKPASVCC
jgi:hypothetical protein